MFLDMFPLQGKSMYRKYVYVSNHDNENFTKIRSETFYRVSSPKKKIHHVKNMYQNIMKMSDVTIIC